MAHFLQCCDALREKYPWARELPLKLLKPELESRLKAAQLKELKAIKIALGNLLLFLIKRNNFILLIPRCLI
jgi:hypothetical protein